MGVTFYPTRVTQHLSREMRKSSAQPTMPRAVLGGAQQHAAHAAAQHVEDTRL